MGQTNSRKSVKAPKPLTPTQKYNQYLKVLKTSKHYPHFIQFFGLIDKYDFAIGSKVRKSIGQSVVKGQAWWRNTQDAIQETKAELALATRAKDNGKRYRPLVRAKEINRKRFLEHFANDTTLYISGSRSSYNFDKGAYLFPLVFDIDDKQGLYPQEVVDVATLVNQTLNKVLFWEHSTGGKGLHGWCLIAWNKSVEEYRTFCKSLKQSVNQMVEDMGLSVSVDIQAQPPTKNYETMGLPIKAPRLSTVDDFDYFFSHLITTVETDFSGFFPSLLPSMDMVLFGLPNNEEIKSEETDWLDCHSPIVERFDTVVGGLNGSNQFSVSNFSAIEAINKFGVDKVTVENVLDIYEAQGVCTGPRTDERVDRMARCLKDQLARHNPTVRKSDPLWFSSVERNQMVTILDGLIAGSDWKNKRINISDLAVVALLWKKNIANNKGEVSYNSIVGFFRSLGKKMSKEKVQRCRAILIDLGMIEIIEEHSKGQCCIYKWVFSCLVADCKPTLSLPSSIMDRVLFGLETEQKEMTL